MAPKRETLRNGNRRIKAWCICGSRIDVSAFPPMAAETIYNEWAISHPFREGHALATPEQARRARRRTEPS